jgi:hypothetical protein
LNPESVQRIRPDLLCSLRKCTSLTSLHFSHSIPKRRQSACLCQPGKKQTSVPHPFDLFLSRRVGDHKAQIPGTRFILRGWLSPMRPVTKPGAQPVPIGLAENNGVRAHNRFMAGSLKRRGRFLPCGPNSGLALEREGLENNQKIASESEQLAWRWRCFTSRMCNLPKTLGK